MQVISFISRKGGTGKSTSLLNISASINELKPEKEICLLDLDSQANLTLMCGETTNHKYNAFTFIEQWRNDDNFNTLTDTSGIIHLEKFDLIPSKISLAQLDKFGNLEKQSLKHAINNMNRLPDYFMIDTPAQFGDILENTIFASDKIIIPVNADMLSLQGLAQTVDIIDGKYNAKRKIGGILVTRYNPRTKVQTILLDKIKDFAKENGLEVFKTQIRECNALKESCAVMQDIIDYKRNSNASEDYIKLTKELFESEVIF